MNNMNKPEFRLFIKYGDTPQQMVYNYPNDGNSSLDNLDFIIDLDGRVGMWDSSWRPFKEDNCIIMQYIGLKDKKGKKIFEGDIIKYGGNPNLLQVAYNVAGFHLYWKDCKICHFEDKAYSASFYALEVVGNIYENPELLK